MPANSKKATTTSNGRIETLRQPVENIWLAGLGALALTEEEGTRLFRSLVKRGKGFEKDSRAMLEQAISTTKAAPSEAMTRLETGVTSTINGVLQRIGVPTRKEINALSRRVEGLTTTLEHKPVARRRPAGAKTARRAKAATHRTATRA